MNTVIDIRGCHGSGKSTLVRKILSKYENTVILNEDIPYHYIDELNLCVLGRYDMKGSGIDNVKESDRLQKFVEEKSHHHNVIFEGIIVSETFSRWNSVASSIDSNYIFIYLDVELEECIKRIRTRRIESGRDENFNEENVISKHKQIKRTISKLRENGRKKQVHQ